MARDRIVTGIDIGSHVVRVVIGILSGNEKHPDFKLIGIGTAPSTGLRKGAIVDIEEAAHSVVTALEDAERMSGEQISEAFITVSGDHLASHFSTGFVSIGHSTHDIRTEDVRRVLEAAKATLGGAGSRLSGQRVLSLIPRMFCIDGESFVKDPIGMVGNRLEVDAHVITGNENYVRNIERCVTSAGVLPVSFVPAPIAAAEAVLDRRQKELGVVCIDIGAASTSLAVYEEGMPIYTAVLPLGGDVLTHDIALGLRVSLDTAEVVKIEYGSAKAQEVNKREEIDLAKFSRTDTQIVLKRDVANILEARVQEIFHMVRRELQFIERDGVLPAGALLTGGAVRLPGMVDIARDVLRLPVQIGFPLETKGIIDDVQDTSFATVIGSVLAGIRYPATAQPTQIGQTLGQETVWADIKEMLSSVWSVLSPKKVD